MTAPIQLLGIAGSLRKASLNRALLRALGEVLPEGVTLVTFDRLGEIPHYDGDLEAQGEPEPVSAFKAAIAAADAVVFATPEYNASVPGVLKNAIDWGSRRTPVSPFRGKPAGVLGASPGASGTMRAQYHLRQIFVANDLRAMNTPEVFVAQAGGKFDAEGKLTDEPTREHLRKWAVAYAAWVRAAKAAKG